MTALSYKHIKERILKENMIEGYKDLEGQITPNGFDVRVCAIIEIEKAGEIGVTKKDHIPPTFGKAHIIEGYESIIEGLNVKEKNSLKEGTKISLKGLKPYLVVTCEKMNTPEDLYFKIEIKSTLFRYAQMILETAFGEPGYKGRLTFLLLPILDTKLALGSGIAQISFIELSSKAHYDMQKEKKYQGGKII